MRYAASRLTDFGGLENHLLAAAIALAVAGSSVSVFGQEFQQESIRTPEPPRYQTFAANPAEAVLFRAGPFSGTGDVSLGYTFNDNANTSGTTTSGTSKLSLNQIFENLDLNLAWVLSPLNRIDLQLDGQLQENLYSNGSQVLNVAIQASQIRFQATVRDVLLQAYEQFAFVQDPVSDPTTAGQTNLNRLTNTIGMSASVPLYRAQAGLEFDYTYNDILGGSGVGGSGSASQQAALIRNSLHLGGNFGFEIAPYLTAGVETNATHNTGAGPLDTNSLSGGGFLRGRLTRLIDVDTGAGILTGEGRGVGKPEYYAYLSARHQVSRNLQVLVGISRDVGFSSGQGVSLNNQFHVGARLSASRRWVIGASPFINFGDVVTGTLPGRYTQYGITVDSSYLLSGNISIDLNYRYVKREGEGPSASYTQNLFGFAVTYKFGASGE